MSRLRAICLLSVCGLALTGPVLAEGVAVGRPRVGETLEYGVYWGLIPAGSATISCARTNLYGADRIVLRIQAKSNWLVSTLYHVDDDVRCYLDPETGLPVRVEKSTREGGFVCRDTLTFDRPRNTVTWRSDSAGIITNYPVAPDALDAVSFLFALRNRSFALDEPQQFSIAVDNQVHRLSVTASRQRHEKFEGLGRVRTTCFEAAALTDGLFVRKIPEEIWIAETQPRVVTQLKGRVPAGSFRMVLKRARPPLQRREASLAAVSPRAEGRSICTVALPMRRQRLSP